MQSASDAAPELRPQDGLRPPPNFSWCEEGVLSACAFPAEEEHLLYLSRMGVTCLVSLTEERHVKAKTEEGSQLRVVRIPIRDYTPPTIQQVELFVEEVNKTKALGQAACVHCAHGMGRTGTMLACYFMQAHGDDPERAIDRIRELRPGSIETKDQEETVYTFRSHLLKTSQN